MQYFILAATLASATLAAAQLTVNTPPSLVQCQKASLSWTSGSPPYNPSIIPGGQPTAAALELLPATSATTMTWTVDIAAHTNITLQVRDDAGTISYSDQVTIQPGTTTSCSNSGSASAGSPAAGASSAPSGASGGNSSAPSAGPAGASGSGSRPASSAAGAATGSSSRGPSAASSAGPSASASASSAASGVEKIGAGMFTVAAAALIALFT